MIGDRIGHCHFGDPGREHGHREHAAVEHRQFLHPLQVDGGDDGRRARVDARLGGHDVNRFGQTADRQLRVDARVLRRRQRERFLLEGAKAA